MIGDTTSSLVVHHILYISSLPNGNCQLSGQVSPALTRCCICECDPLPGGLLPKRTAPKSLSFFIEHSIQMRPSLVSDVVLIIEARKVKKKKANSDSRGLQLNRILPIGSDLECFSVTLPFSKKSWTSGHTRDGKLPNQ